MKKNADILAREFTENAQIYGDMSNKVSAYKTKKAEKQLEALTTELMEDFEIAHRVIDELIDSSVVPAVIWIASIAISIKYREDYATKRLLEIYNDNKNGLLCMLAKAILLKSKKI